YSGGGFRHERGRRSRGRRRGCHAFPVTKPDLVLMDLDLPRLDGLQATRRLKAEVPRTRVIILSTVGDETCRRAAEKYGADAFLPKSTDIARLLSLIRKG